MSNPCPAADEAIAQAVAFAQSENLDVGSFVESFRVTRAQLREKLASADPGVAGYEIGIRMAETMIDQWVVVFRHPIPVGMVLCNESTRIAVHDDGRVKLICFAEKYR